MTTPAGTRDTEANRMVNADTADVDKIGVFTTAQSALTFPGSVAAVSTIWQVLGSMDPDLGSTNKTVPVVLSLAVGGIIYLTSVTKGAGWRQRLASIGIVIVNSFTIAAAALGIGAETDPNAGLPQ
jgi:hypothetical protein